MAGGLLDKGTLSLREREIAIDRTCARCGAEYEWGVHIALFGERVGFGEAERRATLVEATADCWSPRERLIVRLMDQLHETASVDNALWAEHAAEFRDEQRSSDMPRRQLPHGLVLTNALRLPARSYAARSDPAYMSRWHGGGESLMACAGL